MHDLELKYHLNEPFLEQYGRYIIGLLQGNFGTSVDTGQSVSSLMAEAWPVTVTLALTAWVIEILTRGHDWHAGRPPAGRRLRPAC